MQNLPKNLQKIISDYEKNLKNFLQKNNLNQEFLQDIHERIEEKLELLKSPNHKDIVHIISEIWTPEEIFSEELSTDIVEKNTNNKKNNNLFSRLKRKTEWMIFLWVFKTLSDILNINTFLVRLITFLAVIVLIPITNGIIIPIFFVLYFLVFLILRTKVFSFLFYLWLSCFFGLVFFWSIVVYIFTVGNFHIWNIYPFSNLWMVYYIGITIGVLSVLMLFIYFTARLFGKKFSLYFLLSGVILLLIWVACGIVFLIDMKYKYSHSERVINTYSISKDLNKLIYLDSSLNTWWSSLNGWVINTNMYLTTFLPSKSDNIEFVVGNQYYGTDDLIKKSKNFIKDIKFNINEDGAITRNIYTNNNERFPLLLISSDIKEVRVPPFQKFHHFKITNDVQIVFPNHEKYNYIDTMRIKKYCHQYFYDEDWKLHCDINEDEIKNILSEDRIFSIHDLKNYEKNCKKIYWDWNNFKCDFTKYIESTKKYCQKNKNYYLDCDPQDDYDL